MTAQPQSTLQHLEVQEDEALLTLVERVVPPVATLIHIYLTMVAREQRLMLGLLAFSLFFHVVLNLYVGRLADDDRLGRRLRGQGRMASALLFTPMIVVAAGPAAPGWIAALPSVTVFPLLLSDRRMIAPLTMVVLMNLAVYAAVGAVWTDVLTATIVLVGTLALILPTVSMLRGMVADSHQLTVQIAEANSALAEQVEVAEAATRARSEFLARMSHEIRTPMNGVLGTLRLLEVESLTQDQRTLVSTATGSASSLLTILHDLLDFSKFESGKLELDETEVDVRSLVDELRRMFEVSHPRNGVNFQVKVEPAVPSWVSTDPVRLRQVLTNLLGNAFKFTPSGSISLWVKVPATGNLTFVVADTGIGIAPEEVERVFNPFAQTGPHARRHSGTGLGLAICRQIVSMMEGRIHLQSKEGVGSTFTVTIPAPEVEPSLSRINAAIPSGSLEICLRDMEILVVEDNQVNRMVIGRMLGRLGCKVTMAMDGAEAVQKLQHADYEVVLMDRHMPVMDGLEATRRIRRTEALVGKHTPIVGVTASVMAEDVRACRDAGMDAVIEKPIRPERLLQMLDMHARGYDDD